MFPRQWLFERKLADPREVQLSARFLSARQEFAGNIGYSVGLFQVARNTTTLQLRVEGNTFLVAKLRTPDFPVQSTDYTIAFPLDLQHHRISARLKWTHISSHLGDDFNKIDDVIHAIDVFANEHRPFSKPKKFSREFFELLAAYRFAAVRVYAGAIVAYHVTSNYTDYVPVKPWTLQLGAEWYLTGQNKLVYPYLAADLKPKQQFNWNPDLNIQFGLVVGQQTLRKMRVALEIFTGHSNQGQFFQRKEHDLNFLVAFDF
ncbi:MAG: DUF1207 domain-containing protein [bacterium]